ncbi:L-lactate dehydrogenase [Agromyces seonyuensis]|uniref:L-lactate dehydrogenase n=1 Tax=Agromyces seonyuensis TaxID=2662446 RepID=A0A6I4P5L3_9MICO|nr:L-lactate dehydrogenase [Agromyces seonyuensis]MWB98734.1 L-lactate dehydrogenase [Agromyces seonyuensis]
MAKLENSKLSVIGAGGVGTATAYAALLRGSARTVALYDVATQKVEAEVADLAHGSQFFHGRVIGGDDLAVVDGSDLVIITAGARQKEGQTRLDLAGANIRLLEQIVPGVVEHAPDAIIVLVTNPVDVLTQVATDLAGLAPGRVFGTGTMLDSSRLRWRLAERLGVSTSSIHALIVGEHGDTEFPLWSQAFVGPVPIADYVPVDAPPLSHDEFDRIAEEVKNAAYHVIAGKGSTNYAIGTTAARLAEAILGDEHVVVPVTSVLHDYRGIHGIALSVPSLVGGRGVEQVLDAPYDDDELRLLRDSAAAIAETRAKFS